MKSGTALDLDASVNAARKMVACFNEAAKAGLDETTMSRSVAFYEKTTNSKVEAFFPVRAQEAYQVLVQGIFNTVAATLRGSGGAQNIRKAMGAQMMAAKEMDLIL